MGCFAISLGSVLRQAGTDCFAIDSLPFECKKLPIKEEKKGHFFIIWILYN
jgi:hypothetical protein